MRTVVVPQPPWDPRYAGTSSGAPGLAGDIPFTGGTDERAAGADSARAPVVRPVPPPGAPPAGSPPAPPDSARVAPPATPSDTSYAVPPDTLRDRIDR